MHKVFIAILLLLTVACAKETKHRYIPLIFNGSEIIENESLMNDEHFHNIIKVLDYYNEQYQVENGNVYIGTADRGLIWNYTTKANNPAWLEEHK